jgi:hypothetical protein
MLIKPQANFPEEVFFAYMWKYSIVLGPHTQFVLSLAIMITEMEPR